MSGGDLRCDCYGAPGCGRCGGSGSVPREAANRAVARGDAVVSDGMVQWRADPGAAAAFMRRTLRGQAPPTTVDERGLIRRLIRNPEVVRVRIVDPQGPVSADGLLDVIAAYDAELIRRGSAEIVTGPPEAERLDAGPRAVHDDDVRFYVSASNGGVLAVWPSGPDGFTAGWAEEL